MAQVHLIGRIENVGNHFQVTVVALRDPNDPSTYAYEHTRLVQGPDEAASIRAELVRAVSQTLRQDGHKVVGVVYES